MSGPRIVAGTRNSAKVIELAAAFGDFATVVAPPADLTPVDEELGGAFPAVAEAKAVAWSRALTESEPNLLVVASDGGLLVPALGADWDPTRTRRFAGPTTNDLDRANALLALAAHLRGDERRISWREAISIAQDGRVLASFECDSPPGNLAHDFDPAAIESGNGFWIPALWICPEFGGKRLADLTPAERARREDHWTTLGEEVQAFLWTLRDGLH